MMATRWTFVGPARTSGAAGIASARALKACSPDVMVRLARTRIPPRLGSRDLGKRFKMHSEAGPLQLSDGTALDRVPVALLEIGVTEVLVCGLVAEQMVGDDQQGVP